MTLSSVLATRVFTYPDQKRFAALTGDRNPIHLDPVAARRIGAGVPIVHGVHTLLWCLDRVADSFPQMTALDGLKVSFDSFVTVDEPVDLRLLHCDAGQLRIEVRARGTPALTALLSVGDKRTATPQAKPDPVIAPAEALDRDIGTLEGMCGRVPFAGPATDSAAAFPHAARLLEGRGVAALGACTRLIGMICPGLNSIFHRIALTAAEDDGAADIGFRVTGINPTHRRVVSDIWGGGWTGTLTSTMRRPPAMQPAMAALAPYVRPDEFRGKRALIVGGSRGIGETVAKLLAAGGGKPTITYATGEADARRVAAEIRSWGGSCEIMQLDVNRPGTASLPDADANQLYYLATPMIAGLRRDFFEPARLDTFLRFYVAGFYECCRSLLDRTPDRLDALYPSSIFVEIRPAGFVEYAMAKAAGEQLCQDMNDSLKNFRALVCRLPRLATDQNPSSAAAPGMASISATMLPLMRELSSI